MKATSKAQTKVFLTYSLSQFVMVNKSANAVLKSPSHTTNKTKKPKGLFRPAPKKTIGISWLTDSGHRNNKKVIDSKLKKSKKLPSKLPKVNSIFVWFVPIFEKMNPEKNILEHTNKTAYKRPKPI